MGKKVFATVRKKESSLTGVDEISTVKGDVTVIEGIDVAKDGVEEILVSALQSAGTDIVIDVVVHNAGSLSGTREVDSSNSMKEQNLDNVTVERMRCAFEVNTLGPLRVQKALMGANLMTAPGGKVAIISTGFASITDNSSGGNYAYRASKAAVNMISKCLSCDLKEKGISVMAIAPGFVATEFGGSGKEKLASWGAMPVSTSCKGIIELINSLSMDNTGTFFSVKKGGSTNEIKW